MPRQRVLRSAALITRATHRRSIRPVGVTDTDMVYRGSDETPGLQVEQIAQLLIKAGQQDSALLSRAQTVVTAKPRNQVTELPVARHRDQLSSASGTRLAVETDPYMEQLVSIAVASARRAEDASLLATETGRIAKRATVLVTMFGSLGGLMGLAAIVDLRLDAGSAAIASVAPAIADATPRAGNVASDGGPQAPEHMASASSAPASSGAARMPAPGSLPGDIAIAGSPAGSVNGRADAATQTASHVQQPINIPARPVAGVPSATQPYGFTSAGTVPPAAPAAHVQSWPKRYYPAARPVTVSHNSAASGNPVRDFRRFVTAVGEGIRSVFR